MKPNTLPDEDLVSQIESSEGNILYVISRLKSHPIDIKSHFNFGQLIIFEQGKKNGYYKGELISHGCLNQHLEWTVDYFKKLRLCLQESKKEVVYNFEESPDESQSQGKIFKLIFKITKGADVLGLNVKCDFVSTNQVTEHLMKEVIAMNTNRIKAMDTQIKTIKNLETEKMVILENMNDIAQAKEQSEAEMLEKFTIILNEKKKKIISLQIELDQYKASSQADTRNRRLEHGASYMSESDNITSQLTLMPSQLTMYELAVNGSQTNWTKLPAGMGFKDKRTTTTSTFTSSQSIKYSQSIKQEDNASATKTKVNQQKTLKTQLSLSDLF